MLERIEWHGRFLRLRTQVSLLPSRGSTSIHLGPEWFAELGLLEEHVPDEEAEESLRRLKAQALARLPRATYARALPIG